VSDSSGSRTHAVERVADRASVLPTPWKPLSSSVNDKYRRRTCRSFHERCVRRAAVVGAGHVARAPL